MTHWISVTKKTDWAMLILSRLACSVVGEYEGTRVNYRDFRLV